MRYHTPNTTGYCPNIGNTKASGTYNSETLRSLLTSFLKHKEKMIGHLGYSTHKMGQLKAMTTIKLRLAHVPYHDTQRMINLYHSVRLELGELLPGTHSRFQKQREQIEGVLEYAAIHNTVNEFRYV